MTEQTSGVNEGEGTVDLEFWARMPGWYVGEAAALLLEISPDAISSDKSGTSASDLPEEYLRLKRLMMRARTMGELNTPMKPRDFLEWAKSNKIPIPQSLAAAVNANSPLRDWKKRALRYRKRANEILSQFLDAKTLPPKSLKSLYAILLGVAEEKYHFKPDQYNSAASNIETTLRIRGISEPKAQTIRKWLDKAHEAIRQ